MPSFEWLRDPVTMTSAGGIRSVPLEIEVLLRTLNNYECREHRRECALPEAPKFAPPRLISRLRVGNLFDAGLYF